MAVKNQVILAQGVLPHVRLEVTTNVTKKWDESCSIDDQVSFGTTEISRTKPGVAADYVQNQNYINYVKHSRRGPWPMGDCLHLKWRNTQTSHRLKLRKHLVIDETYDFEDCHPIHGYISVEGYQDSLLEFDAGVELYGDVIGSGFTDPYLPIGQSIFFTKTTTLDRMALDTMIPKLDTGFSMPVFLVELAEVKFLFRDLVMLFTKLPEFIRNLLKGGTASLDKISESWLSATFGWLPFVNDVKTIFEKFMNVRQDVERFLDNSNKRQTLHFQKGLSPLTFQTQEWFDPVDSSILYETIDPDWDFADDVFEEMTLEARFQKEIGSLKFHATLDFSYNIPAVSAGLRQFFAELDYWGINLSISDVWQVIPFSFVVDWVFHVGEWLEGLDLENLPVQVVVFDYCRSYKYDLKTSLTFRGLESLTLTPGLVEDVSKWTISPGSGSSVGTLESYYRQTGLPSLSEEQLALQLDTPHGFQWVSAATLAWMRRKKKRKG